MGRHLRPFIQPSLTELYWRYDGTSDTVIFLDALRNTDHALKVLHLLPQPKVGSEAISAATENTVQGMRHLRRAQVPPAGNILEHLASLSTLTHLRIEGQDTTHCPAPFALSPSATNFFQLAEFSVIVPLDSHARVCAFLDAISPRNLRTLRLSFVASPEDLVSNTRDSRNIANSFRQIIKSCSVFAALEVLVVSFDIKPTRGVKLIEDPECILFDGAITPLFQLRSLITLDLQDLPLSISPNFVEQALENWPDIRTLYLGNNSGDTVQTHTTIGDLRLFTPCTRLEELGLAIAQPARDHLDGFVEEDEDDGAGHVNSVMRQISLRVFTRPLARDERYMNDVLGHAFPNARLQFTRGPRSVGYSFRS